MGSSASSQFNEFVIPFISNLIEDEASANTLIRCEIQTMNYEDFVKTLGELNQLSKRCLDPSGKQLVFAVKKGSDSTVFWKATVQIACVKLNAHTQKVDSYRLLSLSEFLRVFKTLKCQYSAIEQSRSLDATVAAQILNSTSLFDNFSDSSPTNVQPLECCICLERPIEISLPCTHSYCLCCIEQWNECHDTCPICREKLESTEDTWVLSEVPKAEEISEEICSDLMKLATEKSHKCSTS